MRLLGSIALKSAASARHLPENADAAPRYAVGDNAYQRGYQSGVFFTNNDMADHCRAGLDMTAEQFTPRTR